MKGSVRDIEYDYRRSISGRTGKFVDVLKYLFYDKTEFGDSVCILEPPLPSKRMTRSSTKNPESINSPYVWPHDMHIGHGVYGSMAEIVTLGLDTEEARKIGDELDEMMEKMKKMDEDSEEYKKLSRRFEELYEKELEMVNEAKKENSPYLRIKKKVRIIDDEGDNIYATPKSFDDAINNCLSGEKSNAKYIIAPITYDTYDFFFGFAKESGGHAGALVFDMSGRNIIKVERYEPHGATTGLKTHAFFDDSIKRFLDNVDYFKKNRYIYYKPQDYCIAEGMQAAEDIKGCSEILAKFLNKKDGFCALWSIIYMYMRVHPKTQHLDRSTLSKSVSELILKDPSLCGKVAKFAYYILEPNYEIGRHYGL